VHTIGHSTRPIDELIALLGESGVELLVDVRRFPVSRRHPQFGKDRLALALADVEIGYRHEPDLGGHRTPRQDSPNTAWREPAFRGYADHMDSPEFRDAVGRVLGRAALTPIVVMCAEADPRRCHRQLLADALVVRGAEVRHILGPGSLEGHVLHPKARLLSEGRIVYDGGRQLPLV
jgi:uncharacterized protein (DUF488 family)